MSSVWSRIVATLGLMFWLSIGALWGQNQIINPKINSPYSRFGLGNRIDQSFIAAGAMGGLGAAFQDPYYLNMRNPASLASLQATAFEFGFSAKYALMKGGQDDAQTWSGNLEYLALGFPLTNPINRAMENRRPDFSWGMAFALQPYSQVGYNVQAELSKDEIISSSNSLKGSGGTYRIVWGNGVRYKNLSAGINAAYLFGEMTNNRRVTFDSLTVPYSSEFNDDIGTRGFMFEGGLQYVVEFKETNDKGEREPSGKRIVMGATGTFGSAFRTTATRFIRRDNFVLNHIDTILYEENIKQNGKFAPDFSFGVTYEDANKFRAGVEYYIGKGSKYENEAKPEVLNDSYRFAFGMEFIPDYTSYNNYFKRIRYRLGGYYGNDPRSFEGDQLQEYALTLGMGFPIVRPREQSSLVNFGLEIGQFGLSDVIRETFVRISLGFTLNDNTWFFKRKFN